MFRAWSAGVGVLVAAYATWFTFLQLGKFSEAMMVLLWLSPLVAAFVSSYLGPSKKILLGTSMAVPAAFLAVLFNLVDQLLDISVDFPGVAGAGILFTLTLAYATVLASMGALFGYYLTRNSG